MTRTSGEDTGNDEKRRGGMTARSVLHAMWRRPLTLFGVALLAAAVGAGVWFFLPLPKSTAAAVFHVANSRPWLLDSNAGGGDGNSFRQSQITLIKRRLTLNAVLKQQGVQNLALVRKQPDPVAWLDNALKVEVKPNNDFVRVTLEGDNDDDLLVVLDALAKAYLADADERDNGARRDRLKKLEDTNRTYRIEVERFHKRIDTIALALGSKDGPTLVVVDSIMKDELRAAHRDLAVARDALQWADLGPTAPGPNKPETTEPAATERPGIDQLTPWTAEDVNRAAPAVVTAAEIEAELRSDLGLQQLEAEVQKTKQALTDTQALFAEGERPTAVVLAEDKLKAAEQKRDKYRTDRRSAVEALLRKRNEEKDQARLVAAQTTTQTLKKREAQAKAKVDDILRTISKSNDYRIELENLKSMIGQTEKLSGSLGETCEKLKVELGAAQRVTLADDPHVVPGIEGNRRLKFTLLAALAVLGLGFATVIGWEHRSRRLTHSDEIAAALGVRLLGSVPAFGREPEQAKDAHPVLVEAIDATRTMLVHGTDHPNLRVLVVTSAVSGEGKTSLTGHLAISLARAGFRTLLVDGDLRSPTAHRVFDAPLAPGLCEVLEGRAGVTEAARPTGVPGLSVLTAGEWTAATRQALVGDRWRATKDELKAAYDYIVVDTSPLLLVSDSLLLAREADGVVVSVLLGVSQVALVDEAVARLQTVRAKIAGVIANGARAAAHEYTSGYGYRTPERAAVPTTSVAIGG